MRDPRFRDDELWREQMGRVRAEAEAALNALGPADVLIAAVAVLLQVNDAASCSLLSAALPAFPGVLREDIELYLEGQIELREASWSAIVHALASLAILGLPSSKRLEVAAERLHRAPQWAHDAFEAACVTALEGLSASQREAWLVEFERPLAIVEPEPKRSGAIQVSRQMRAWELHDVFDLWGGNVPWAIEALSGNAPLYLLRRLAPQRWFRSVDAWADARLVGGALFGDHVLHDREALLSWMAAAATVFDSDARWTGRTAAVILTRDVLRHATMLLGAVDRQSVDPDETRALALATRALRETELPAFFAQAWEVLLARSDGLVIGAALLADLSDAVHSRRGDELVVRELAHEALARALAERQVRTCELRDRWLVRRRVRDDKRLGVYAAQASGLAVLASAVDVIERGGPRDDDLFAMLLERVAAPDPDWARLARAGALNPLLVRLLRLVTPSAEILDQCERLYGELEPARRRAEFGRTYIESDADMSSLLLLVIALGLVDEPGIDPTRATETVERILRWATRLVLTGSPALDPTLSAPRIFGFAVRLCARLAPACLADAIAIALPDPALAAVVAATLLSVLSRTELEDVLRAHGENVDGLAVRARTWAEATERTTDRDAARELEAALDR